jgi:hypothetical protein
MKKNAREFGGAAQSGWSVTQILKSLRSFGCPVRGDTNRGRGCLFSGTRIKKGRHENAAPIIIQYPMKNRTKDK